MKEYKIKIYAEVLQDITSAKNWYNKQSPGLGSRFQNAVVAQIKKLQLYGEIYAIRYDDYRCMLIKKFPFMVHYRLDVENREVHIYALHHTSLDPKIWNRQKD